MNAECFALLDDASPADPGRADPGRPDPEQARSRLYTGHLGTLVCSDIALWPQLLGQMQQALRSGQHAVCLCTYELGSHVLATAPRGGTAPLAQILLFNACQHLSAEEVAAWLAQRSGENETPAGIARVTADVGEAEFAAALARIHNYILAGDAYQVNYTYRLRFDAFGSLFALYARVRARQPVPYGALVALADGSAVLSLSPELFVRHKQGQLTAQPMKGTAPAARPERTQENAALAGALAADPKNRAENLMIVDLLRNDIGRIAVTGSVQVPALFEVKRYGSVLQMTSTVQARLRRDISLAEIFVALYPCGSITGAPKRRAMEIIDELEPAARGIYTGAIGWFEAPESDRKMGDFCLSVPIRTLVLEAPADGRRRGHMGVGAGIVFDSDARDEFAECQLKARFLTGLKNDFELFETMYATRADGARHLERHLARLAASAVYFGFAHDMAHLHRVIGEACAGLAEAGPYRLRLALNQGGVCDVQSAPLTPWDGPVRLRLSSVPMQANNLFLRHKSTVRACYDQAWRAAEMHGAFDALFFNERGELTEGGRSNVFLKLNGHWHTPPLSAGVLPGIMRAVLLADPTWDARETILTRQDLRGAQEVAVCNALRGKLAATLVWDRCDNESVMADGGPDRLPNPG